MWVLSWWLWRNGRLLISHKALRVPYEDAGKLTRIMCEKTVLGPEIGRPRQRSTCSLHGEANSPILETEAGKHDIAWGAGRYAGKMGQCQARGFHPPSNEITSWASALCREQTVHGRQTTVYSAQRTQGCGSALTLEHIDHCTQYIRPDAEMIVVPLTGR